MLVTKQDDASSLGLPDLSQRNRGLVELDANDPGPLMLLSFDRFIGMSSRQRSPNQIRTGHPLTSWPRSSYAHWVTCKHRGIWNKTSCMSGGPSWYRCTRSAV